MNLEKQHDAVASLPGTLLRVPEILAPAGGRAQFFAALRVGADAVYLGLKDFNARARAENFTIEDLEELLPIARQYQMKVLVTFNVLIKNEELEQAIKTLSELERVGVDAIIVQDLAVVRLARKFFPSLRVHASTQMAIHNLAGVEKAAELGIRRAVLARELTAAEVKRIRAAVPIEQLELEVFCHGSLCYSYSGLCFFSGAADARSGNRGECAYTCRQPYKILSEPGNGFLFSMRDLDTSNQLSNLVTAGVDCLKIEGRKKDAQYVASVTRLYREKLNQLFGTNTLRMAARELVSHDQNHTLDEATIRSDLGLSFQRRPTSFFVKGRYVENVIDLDNPGHLGNFVGTVDRVEKDLIATVPAVALERFDGLRIDQAEKLYQAQPQGDLQENTVAEKGLAERYNNEVCQFSLREMYLTPNSREVPVAKAGQLIWLKPPTGIPMPRLGDRIFKTRSSDLKSRVENLARPPKDQRLRRLEPFDLEVVATWQPAIDQTSILEIKLFARRFGATILSYRTEISAPLARNSGGFAKDLTQHFSLFGDQHFVVEKLSLNLPQDQEPFVPSAKLKDIKRDFASQLRQCWEDFFQERQSQAKQELVGESFIKFKPSTKVRCFYIKIDRLEYLSVVESFSQKNPEFKIAEIIFEHKRAFLGGKDDETILNTLTTFAGQTGIAVRLAVPTVLRAWDLPLAANFYRKAIAAGFLRIEVGNLGAIKLCEEWNAAKAPLHLTGDFTLYSLNSQASLFWHEQGLQSFTLSIEDDLENLTSQLQELPAVIRPQAILYKDTPLFIAEACSLTALHNGCPSSSVCGYRTLEVANQKGERFFVAHESCKSIVYGDQAYSVSHEQDEFLKLGVSDFKIEFLTRPYSEQQIETILRCVSDRIFISNTHAANFRGRLL